MFGLVAMVALGGALGASLRYLIGEFFSPYALDFPLATFLANVLGCLLIGFVSGLVLSKEAEHPYLIAFASKGFCGGFTTFSSFSLESLKLAQSGRMLLAFAYVVVTLLACFAGVLLGFYAAKIFV